MEALRVRVGERSYPAVVAAGALDAAGSRIRETLGAARAAVLADRRVAGLHGDTLRASLDRAGVETVLWAEIPPGERSKNLDRARRLYGELLEAGVDRWTPVVAFGGGVVGDLGGFVASTLLRGLPLVQIPTTVLAQVDSSIGGKTAVNFGGGKNLVGTFHQPALVVADPEVLATLTPRDFRSGLVEAVKIGVTLRPDLMDLLESRTSEILARDPGVLADVVRRCVETKGEVVGRDEREEHVRAILNYGHTIGHALEAASLGRMRHGEAVAVGMHAAAWVGERLGVTAPEVSTRQNDLLLRLGLKLTRPGADKEVIARKLKLDKKVRDRRTRFVLTLQIGGASVWPRIPEELLVGGIAVATT